MSFLVKQPTLPQSATGLDPKFASGYKAAEVVPLGWGREVYPSKWISDKYDKHTQKGGSNRPDWHYCSILAGYCQGPVDYIGKVFINGVSHVINHAFDPGDENYTITINADLASGRAWTGIVHRGNPDTPESAVAAVNAATAQTHPPYRGLCWIEWQNIDLGQGSAALPSIAVEFGKNAPAVGALAAGHHFYYGVNPFAAAYALLLDAAGGDFDASLLDATHWGAQAVALETDGVAGRTGELVKCHPSFAASTSLGDALSQILAQVDGYIYAADGQLRVGWFPSAAVDAGALPEITEHDLETKPGGGGFPDWNEGATSVVVVFKSFDKDYGDDAARYNAPANRESVLSAEPVRQERPWIHASDQAAIIAAEGASDAGRGDPSTNLTVLKSRAVSGGLPLLPGALINWDYAPHSLDLVCRVVARRCRMDSASDILTVQRERGAYPRPYVAAVDERVPSTPTAPGEIDVADVRLWLLPSGFTALRQIAPLVNRAHRGIYRVDLHLSTAGVAPWSVILDSRFFTAKAAVSGAINDSVATVRVVSTSVDFARMAAQDAVAQADDALCLLIGDEVCSVSTITVFAANTYDLGILRGRRGTTAAAHADAAVAWLFYRSELASVEHEEFYRVRDGSNVYNVPIATKYFKLQLFTIEEDGLAKPDDPGISLVLPDLSADESVGYTIILTNEAHTVAAANDGTVNAGQLGAGGTARTDVKVFRGSTLLTAVAAGPNSDQFSVAVGTLTNTTATKEDNDTVRCDTLTADTGTIELTVSVAGAFSVAKIFTLTKAKAGAAGAPGLDGDDGAAGIPGPGLVYVGAYNGANTYYHTTSRRDIVSSGGSYYVVNNPAKSGTATWGAPGGGDWTAPDATYKFVATALLLAEDATILKTLVMGDGVTAGAGLIRSAGATAFATGAGFWLGYDGTTPKFRIGNPAGKSLAWDGANLTATFGSGTQQTVIADTYFLFGDPSGSFFRTQRVGSYVECGTPNLNFGDDVDGGYLSIKYAGGTALLGFECNSGKLKFTNDANAAWYRPGAGRLKSDGDVEAGGKLKSTGNGEIGGTLTVTGETTLNAHLNLANAVDLKCGGDIYLGLAGTNRWLYDCDSNRILQKRYSSAAPADATDLTSAIDLANWCKALALHHGLGA